MSLDEARRTRSGPAPRRGGACAAKRAFEVHGGFSLCCWPCYSSGPVPATAAANLGDSEVDGSDPPIFGPDSGAGPARMCTAPPRPLGGSLPSIINPWREGRRSIRRTASTTLGKTAKVVRLLERSFTLDRLRRTPSFRVEVPSLSGWSIPSRDSATVFLSSGRRVGKISACMSPFSQQLCSWQAGRLDRYAVDLVLEVKADFFYATYSGRAFYDVTEPKTVSSFVVGTTLGSRIVPGSSRDIFGFVVCLECANHLRRGCPGTPILRPGTKSCAGWPITLSVSPSADPWIR